MSNEPMSPVPIPPRAFAAKSRGRWHRIALICSASALLLGLATIIAWTTGLLLLASIRSSYIPMAPITALGFVLMGIALFTLVLRPHSQLAKNISLLGGLLAGALGAMKLTEFATGFHFGLEEFLVRNPQLFGQVPTGRMSPITASDFVLASAAIVALLFGRLQRWAGIPAAILTTGSLLVVLGYLYGTPFLYGGSIIPVALSTGLAFLCIGVGLIAAAGPGRWPLRPLTGSSTQALLLRAFLPITVIGALVNGALLRLAQSHFHANPALVSGFTALVSAIAIAIVILEIAAKVGARIDKAEAEQALAQQALLLLNQELERRVAERTRALKAKNEQMEEELKMARELQLALLPQDFPRVPSEASARESALQFFKFYYPTGSVSGDFFDVIPLSDTTVGIFVCDVMGHGVRAALVTAMMRALVEELSKKAESPGALLTQINLDLAAILKQTGTIMYATAVYLVADVGRGRLLYANAGHPKPLHWRSQAGEVEPVHLNGKPDPAMGLFRDVVYSTFERPLSCGDFLLLFRDGLFEVDGPEGEQYSQERLLAAVRQRTGLDRAAMLSEVLGEIQQFSLTKSFEDDVCLVGMEVTRLCNGESVEH